MKFGCLLLMSGRTFLKTCAFTDNDHGDRIYEDDEGGANMRAKSASCEDPGRLKTCIPETDSSADTNDENLIRGRLKTTAVASFNLQFERPCRVWNGSSSGKQIMIDPKVTPMSTALQRRRTRSVPLRGMRK
eukprot:786270_1